MQKKFIFISVLILSIAGCKDESINPLNLTFEIQPLKTGNTYYFVDSTKIGFNWKIDSTRITIPGRTTLNGEPNSQGVAIWEVYTNGNLIRTNFLNLEEDGLYHYREITGDDTLELRKLWAKYPVNVGEQFIEPRYNYNPALQEYTFEANYKWHCVSVDSQITLKNGNTLFCHVFLAHPDSMTDVYLIYALNVGYTGWIVNRNGERVYRQILTDYHLN